MCWEGEESLDKVLKSRDLGVLVLEPIWQVEAAMSLLFMQAEGHYLVWPRSPLPAHKCSRLSEAVKPLLGLALRCSRESRCLQHRHPIWELV